MPATDTRELAVDGAALRFDIRPAATGSGSSDDTVLFLIGSPMDATGFTSLASHFTDRTVVTYDPRGVGRSVRTDGAAESTPEKHADDVRRVIEALGVESVDLFASSGGAVNALALAERHGALVRTLVAHEPPTAQVLPDREAALAVCASIHETYLREGFGPAMVRFILTTSHQGEFPAPWADGPAPSPATFGLPVEDDGSRDDPLLGQNIRSCTGYLPDFTALRAAPTRIVIAAGEESEGTFAARAAAQVAAGLGGDLAVFPSHHGGFLGGEFGRHGAPEQFAGALRKVLDAGR